MPGQVRFVECAGEGDSAAVDELLALHRRWFPTHSHVQAELIDNARRPRLRGQLVVHQILALVDDQPAGFIVVHTSLRRRIGLIHFLAVDEEFRPVTTHGQRLAPALVDHAVSRVHEDGIAQNLVISNGVTAESEDALISVWAAWGFDALPVDYAEPYFGMHWAAHGEPTFFPMTLVGCGLPDQSYDRESAGRAAAEAFLLDHYQLPADHPRVVQALSPV